MRRVAMLAVGAAVLALGACGGSGDNGGKSQNAAENGQSGGSHQPVTITFWNGFSGRELGVMKHAVADFHRSHPWITVKTVGSVSDDKIISAIRGGNAPDAVQSFTADNTGAFCNSGGWIDLKPYMDRGKVSADDFPKPVQSYTQFEGKRCALPLLADT